MTGPAQETRVYPADSGITDPHSWDQLHADALAAVRASGARKTADIVGVVLDLIGGEAVNRMAGQMMDATRLRSMDFRDGMSMDVEPSREMVALWVGAARGMLGDAENYSETEIDFGLADPPGFEMTVKVAGEFDQYVFRLQRRGKLTPHQARKLAEQRADDAERSLAEAEAELVRLRGTGPEITEWGVRRPDLTSGVTSMGSDQDAEEVARSLAADQERHGVTGALLRRAFTYPDWETVPLDQ